jgi:hypothetical protein
MIDRGQRRYPSERGFRSFGQAGSAGRAVWHGAPKSLNRAMPRHAVATSHHSRDAEAALVFSWRFQALRRAGYPREDAFVLARTTTDLHLATKLLEHGCPPATAVEILR